MVRREEQAWDPSASIVLDSRASAHDGRGMQSSMLGCDLGLSQDLGRIGHNLRASRKVRGRQEVTRRTGIDLEPVAV